MDVVKRKIQALGGRCSVKNSPGEGAEFLITLPLTLAVLEGMTVRAGGSRFILPLSVVLEAIRTSECTIEILPDGSRVLAHRGSYLPVIRLDACLGFPETRDGNGMALIVDTESGGLMVLLVDELLGQRQVVLKSLEANYRRVEGISGATILGDGQVALILDVLSLAALDRSARGRVSLSETSYSKMERIAS
jgi:two-component system chemotaxis sensor kinase CheA